MFMFGPIVFLLGASIAIYVAYDLYRHWDTFWDDDITPQERMQATRVAIFILVPIGVLLHEVGHALAVWQLGGRVVEFNWSFLSGYVVPEGNFTPAGDWWIYFSGNLVSIMLGFAALLVLLFPVRPMIKLLAVTFAEVQLFVSLLGYPLLSLLGVEGDWVGIYGIPPTPIKLVIAVFHVTLLVALLLVMRDPRVRRWRLLLGRDAQRRVGALETRIAADPANLQPRLELASYYRQQGEAALARQTLAEAVAACPNDPNALLAAGALAEESKKPQQAAAYYQQALDQMAPGAQPATVAMRLGQLYTTMERPAEAVAAYTRAIESGPPNAEARYWRGRAYLRLRDDVAAQNDFRAAAALDPHGETGRLAAQELAKE
ncbi:MAG: tetratricopeptide repeat protein [Anaerolineae bacterium]